MSAPPELRTITLRSEITVCDTRDDSGPFWSLPTRPGRVRSPNLNSFRLRRAVLVVPSLSTRVARSIPSSNPEDPVTSSAKATPGDVTTAPQMPIVKARAPRRAACFESMLGPEFFRNRLQCSLTP